MKINVYPSIDIFQHNNQELVDKIHQEQQVCLEVKVEIALAFSKILATLPFLKIQDVQCAVDVYDSLPYYPLSDLPDLKGFWRDYKNENVVGDSTLIEECVKVIQRNMPIFNQTTVRQLGLPESLLPHFNVDNLDPQREKVERMYQKLTKIYKPIDNPSIFFAMF